MNRLQPFQPFKPPFIPRLLELGHTWLVSQRYNRIVDVQGEPVLHPVHLLMSDYAVWGEAKLHFNAVKKDRYAAIIDLKNPVHAKKISEMLSESSGYRVYVAMIRSAKELESHINRHYKEKLKQYVDKQTNWRISHDAIVKPTIQLSFGEIYIILRHANQQIRIKFEDIE